MTDLPQAKTRPASNWSAIWILPLIALMIGAWLAWQAYSERGIHIEVLFDSAEGIEVGKTSVLYKGMTIGVVRELRLEEDGRRQVVVADIEMNKDVEGYLRSGTRFWLVRPSVTLAGITGLETLVSGNYIGISPAEGEETRRFAALAEEPPMSDNRIGLHLTLKADRLGSLNRGSPVFYRQIQVGQVKNYVLAEDDSTVEVQLFIQPEYAHLVRKHTRFWNASGVTVDAGLTGVKFRTESLASIVAGGIAFATPAHRQDSPATDPSIPFRLYEDFDAAQAGIKALVSLQDFDGLQAGRTPVIYKGMQVGLLKKLDIDSDLSGAQAELSIDPLFEDYLVEDTQFWVVKPSVSVAGISGLEALVRGNYISVRPGEKGAEPRRNFVARAKAPPLDIRSPGLHLVLTADNLGSLDVGSPVLYRQVRVGSVQSYQFSRDQQRVVVGVHIEQPYADLVNSSSRFWNASGISLSGGLSGIEVRSESLQSLLAGGIAFETPDPQAPATKKVPRFKLHKDRGSAIRRGTSIEIRLTRGDGLGAGTPIRYKGLEVGEVDSVTLSDDLGYVVLRARITTAESRIARAGTQFWVVRPELGIMRTANLDTLVSGPYLEVAPGKPGSAEQTRFNGEEREPQKVGEGLTLVLSAARLGSIKPGNAVTYREVKVGEVTGYELGQNADRVLIRVLIEPRYAPLVHTGSRFWETSGFGVDFSLFKGASLRTDSLESLIEGGVAFATPDGEQRGRRALPGQTFALFKEPQEEWFGWAPKIELGRAETRE
ncbi:MULTISPECIES: PqiB family protein [Stutzerimonas stutzeri subgroup]|jgi:paraquat-inducible protein B|uniref:PqiB family protein n=1 Tax=Stutzerimonas stutzeri NF13 TaxID=1212548 RepID=M2V613_STUST|nr:MULTISPECIES: MlaD family protein [Stutzerimonas stutzeri subgroup]EME01287.1 PqiB family protein [Stutzerimonas stutzeri NF13]MBK3880105.1 MCE family protein [Stutzerimonas stutzeri]WOF78058.1 MlaD family protein [Pseudomonas sp. FeN3W]